MAAALDQQTLPDSLADEAAMSRRNFTRHFKALTGTTVKAWLLTERLALAQRLLESSDLNIDVIAQAAGFGSVAALRQRFRETFGISPTEWRTSFRMPVAEASGYQRTSATPREIRPG